MKSKVENFNLVTGAFMFALMIGLIFGMGCLQDANAAISTIDLFDVSISIDRPLLLSQASMSLNKVDILLAQKDEVQGEGEMARQKRESYEAVNDMLFHMLNEELYDYDYSKDVVSFKLDTDELNLLKQVSQLESSGQIVRSNLFEITAESLIQFFKQQGAEVDVDNFRSRLFIGLINAVHSKPEKEKPVVLGTATSFNRSRDVRMLCGLSADEIEARLPSGLKGRSKFLLQMQDKYGIDLALAVAVAITETSGGTAGYAKTQSNIFNIRLRSGDYVDYSGFDDPFEASIEAFFNLLSRRYLPDANTVDSIGKIYAEAPDWGDVVCSYMTNFYEGRPA